MVRENVDKYNENKIPLDGIWFDIPYMKQFASFTVDTEDRYKFDKEVAKSWQAANKKLIPVIDAGLSSNSTKYVEKAIKD